MKRLFLLGIIIISIAMVNIKAIQAEDNASKYTFDYYNGVKTEWIHNVRYEIPLNWEITNNSSKEKTYSPTYDSANTITICEMPNISEKKIASADRLMFLFGKDLYSDYFSFYGDPISFENDHYYICATTLDNDQNDNIYVVLRAFIVMKKDCSAYSITYKLNMFNYSFNCSYDAINIISSICPIRDKNSTENINSTNIYLAENLGYDSSFFEEEQTINEQSSNNMIDLPPETSPEVPDNNNDVQNAGFTGELNINRFGDFNNGVTYYVTEDNHYGIAYSSGLLLAPSFDYIGDFYNNMAPVHINGKFGLIDIEGNFIIEPYWDYLSEYSTVDRLIAFSGTQKVYGSVIFPDEGTFYIIDSSNKIIKEIDSDSIPNRFLHGICQNKINGKTGYLNPDGEYVIKPEWDSIGVFTDTLDYVSAEKDGHKYIIDISGNIVLEYNKKYDISVYCDSLFPFRNAELDFTLDGFFKYGYMDKMGNIAIKQQWDFAHPFSEELAAVQSDDKWGYINPSGELVIPLEWDFAYSFENGLAKVEANDLYGYIDKNGTLVIPCVYSKITNFDNGLAYGCKNNIWYLVTSDGFEKQLSNISYKEPDLDPIIGTWRIKTIKYGDINIECNDDTYATMTFDKYGFYSSTISTKGDESSIMGYYQYSSDDDSSEEGNDESRTYILSNTRNGSAVGFVLVYTDTNFMTAALKMGGEMVYYSSEEKQ